MASFIPVERSFMSLAVFGLASATAFFTAYIIVITYLRRAPTKSAPPVCREDYPLTGAIGFWTKRWDFYKNAVKRSYTGNFSFHAGPNTIVALSGEKGRKLFFESRELNIHDGYAVLFGSSPQLDDHDDKVGANNDQQRYFPKRLVTLLKNDQFDKKLSTLISDCQEGMDAILNTNNGVTDPFESIYRLVFRLTIRVVGADELAEDPVALETFLKYFEMIDQSATAVAVMFPKFPSPAVIKRTYAGARLYMMVESIIKKRTESGEKHDDPLQFLLDQGDRTFKIIEFMVGALFAGLLNSGINAAWVLAYLATTPEWMAKCLDEVRTVAGKYARNPNAPLRYQLDDVPLEAWEGEFPVIDLVLRESMRLNLLGAGFRKNSSGKPVSTGHGNEVIPPGAFVTYAIGDVHLNPDIYPNPEEFDPSRHLPPKAEDKKVPHAFLGWGAGRHPCLGMRFAKLEMNLIAAYFLAAFDFQLQDKHGKRLEKAPPIDFNGHSAHKPPNRPYLKVFPREK